jgi:hypothetical protein
VVHEHEPAASLIRWEEPDTCFLSLVGVIDGDEMRRISQAHRGFTVGRHYVLGLVDVSQVRAFTAEARTASRAGGKDVQVRGTAIYGASRHIQIVATILLRGLDLLHKRTDRPVRFFNTETEARAWLSERRRVICEREVTTGA